MLTFDSITFDPFLEQISGNILQKQVPTSTSPFFLVQKWIQTASFTLEFKAQKSFLFWNQKEKNRVSLFFVTARGYVRFGNEVKSRFWSTSHVFNPDGSFWGFWVSKFHWFSFSFHSQSQDFLKAHKNLKI